MGGLGPRSTSRQGGGRPVCPCSTRSVAFFPAVRREGRGGGEARWMQVGVGRPTTPPGACPESARILYRARLITSRGVPRWFTAANFSADRPNHRPLTHFCALLLSAAAREEVLRTRTTGRRSSISREIAANLARQIIRDILESRMNSISIESPLSRPVERVLYSYELLSLERDESVSRVVSVVGRANLFSARRLIPRNRPLVEIYPVSHLCARGASVSEGPGPFHSRDIVAFSTVE